MKINESQLRKIIKESIKNILKETHEVTFENVEGILKNLKRNFPDELDQIFDNVNWSYCFGEQNDYVIVELNGKYNYVDVYNNLISKKMWFDEAEPFYNGYATVCVGDKYNFIDGYGKILSPNKWFDFVEPFDRNGLAEVTIGDREYILTKNGEFKKLPDYN